MTFKDYVNEAVKKMSDEKIDSFIAKEWNGKATTFFYNAEAVMEIAVALKQDDVVVTKDMKFFHIPANLDVRVNNQVNKIILKHKVKEAMNESAASEGKEVMNNKDGKKFMNKIYDLLDSGAEIESYAMGRWGFLKIPMDRRGINVFKLTPSGKVSKRGQGWTSFSGGDTVILYDLGDNKFVVKNDISAFQD